MPGTKDRRGMGLSAGQIDGKEGFGLPEMANQSAMITGALLRLPALVTPGYLTRRGMRDLTLERPLQKPRR